MSRFRAAAATLETALYAAAGAAALTALHLPAGGLLGAMLAVAAASLAGRPMGAPHPLQSVIFMVMGSSVGAAATPSAVASLVRWPASLGLLIGATLLMYAAGYVVFRRAGGWDRVTALYASSPGALSAVMIMAQGEGADMSKVATAQVLRLAAITCASPLLLTRLQLQPAAAAIAVHSPLVWPLFALAVVMGWKLAERLHWPSPAFLGPMAVSAVLHLTGVMALKTPQPVLTVASAAVGGLVGARFRGVQPKELLRYFPPAALSFSTMGATGVLGGLLAGHITGVGPAAGVLAFAPGSMDVLIAISLAIAASPAYVAAHHTVRLLLVLGVLPLLGRRRVDADPASEAE
jgi:membrane AbrB-like protein